MSHTVLISVIGFGASWSGPAELTPWSVFVIVDGKKVLNGGSYPDECENARLILSDVTQHVAESVAISLECFLRDIEIDVSVEILGDG
jgi:hypothetical protein